MQEEIKLSTFPYDRSSALAFLYAQNQDLSGKTPFDLVNIYQEAQNEIRDAFSTLTEGSDGHYHVTK